jgi:hypothetical protein
MNTQTDEANVSAAYLLLAINRIIDLVEEPCNRLDYDDFERGEAAMAASVFWIINDTLGIGKVYGAQ